MASNRIGGDFDSDAVEAFRAAYASQYLTPQDQEVHELSGLPTNTISNTSPWIESTGLWKYPSGKGPEEDLRAPFNPEAYYTPEPDEDEVEELNLDEMSPAEFDAFLEMLDEEQLEALSEHLGEQLGEEQEDDGLTEEEVDALINELLGELDDTE